MASSDELLTNLKGRRTNLVSQRQTVSGQIDALVDGIARRKAIKSVGRRIVALEERQEQLDDEILEIDLDIEATKAKVVSAQSMTDSLTTFGDLYQEALPEERRELIRLRVNQLVWTPEEIRLALSHYRAYQKFDESQQLVAHASDSSNIGLVWDKFHVHQGHRSNTPFIQIGKRRRSRRIEVANIPIRSSRPWLIKTCSTPVKLIHRSRYLGSAAPPAPRSAPTSGF